MYIYYMDAIIKYNKQAMATRTLSYRVMQIAGSLERSHYTNSSLLLVLKLLSMPIN